MRKYLYSLIICFVLTLPVFAQTGVEIEVLLSEQAVNYGQAARFVLQAADVQDLSPEEAFRFAAEHKWIPENVAIGDKVRLDGVSLLIMEAFGIRGGLFYSMVKAPHYAYRELVYKDIIQGRTDPGMPVSGDFLLFIVGRVLSETDETEPWDTNDVSYAGILEALS